jgi:hypothetical protein
MRYWAEVAGAVSKAQAAGRGALVVADKNLVPMPPNMFQDAAEALRLSGGRGAGLFEFVRNER